MQPEQVGQGALQPLIGQRLKRLEVGGDGMQARPERRATGRRRRWCDNPRAAGWAAHSQTSMMRDKGPDLGHVDPLVHADGLGRQVRTERRSAAGALARTVLDDLIGRLAEHPAVALVSRLGSARLGPLPLLLAIRRGGLGGGARGLLRPLQAQNQFDQLFLAQTLNPAAALSAFKPAKPASLKGLGNCPTAVIHLCTALATNSGPLSER